MNIYTFRGIENPLLLTIMSIGAMQAMWVLLLYQKRILILGILLCFSMTPIDEFAEIEINNVGVALMVASIINTLTILSKDGVALILESITPYPDLPPR